MSTAASPQPVRFRRQFPGCYWGQSDRHSIRLLREGGQAGKGRWEISVRELVETAGVKHALNQPIEAYVSTENLPEAKRVAARFVETVGGSSKHLLQQVLHEAAVYVINRDIEAIKADPDYQAALSRRETSR